uniref:SLH domain-containing protein n=1 Tax=Noccaea caerulescens TaxID=107243 RepID=A0A1J3EJS5_NOCCA
MASATATWTPNSLQLRLALSSSVRRGSHSGYLRPSRFGRKSGCGVVCVSQKPEVEAWTGSDSSKPPADGLAGWDDSGNDDKSSRAAKKSWIEGVVGAGVVGIFFVAGLSYAVASFNKPTTPRLKQEMQPLTSQQENVLISSDEPPSEEVKLVKSEETNLKDEDKSIENSDIGQLGGEDKVLGTENSSFDDVITDGTDGTEHITSQNTPEADLQSDPDTAESDKIISESKSLLDASTEAVLLDSESSHLAGAEDPDSLPNTEPTNVSDLENHVNTQKEDSLSSLSDSDAYVTTETVTVGVPVASQSDLTSDTVPLNDTETAFSTVAEELPEVDGTPEYIDTAKEIESSKTPVPESAYLSKEELNVNSQDELGDNGLSLEIPNGASAFSSAGIPAPSISFQVIPGKILVPAAADQVQCQAFAALQVLKVIETDTQPSDLCTRREYARWLVSASSALSRNTTSKVYPAMYIENVTELAFDDITPEDPDFTSIQGLAEAGLITSKLSNRDLLNDVEGTFLFSPESLLSRQDLISWKMALEKRQLPEADKKKLFELSGFIDIDKINTDAWPAIIADLSTGEQGIAALAFGCTRLFQPHKPVTKAQAAIALSSGEASEIVSEELARIEAESMAEKAVSAHNALVAEVEKDVNASFEKELSMEREKIEAVEKMAEQAKLELEQLREKREEENLALLKERAAVESEMEVLSRLRREAEEKLEDLMSNKAEISFEKERVSNLRKDAEEESQQITKLHYELEVERKALSMARSWAEEEGKRAGEQARALEEARKRWETNGLRVIVDKDLQEKSSGETEQSLLLNTAERSSVEETEERAQTLMEKLKEMAGSVGERSREVIFIVMDKIRLWIMVLKEYAESLGKRAGEMREAAIVRAKGAAEEVEKGTAQVSDKVKRMAEECRDGVGKISQKFKT